MLYRIVDVKALPQYRLWVKFENGIEGEVDLSNLVGKGVFKAWRDPGAFEQVYVDDDACTAAWPGGLDLAPDALYRDIAGVGLQ